jgi:hypothetical protein
MLSAKEVLNSQRQHGLRQIFTKRYTPKINGKAKRFIQTALRERAYAQASISTRITDRLS